MTNRNLTACLLAASIALSACSENTGTGSSATDSRPQDVAIDIFTAAAGNDPALIEQAISSGADLTTTDD